jgi:hypothetical protein
MSTIEIYRYIHRVLILRKACNDGVCAVLEYPRRESCECHAGRVRVSWRESGGVMQFRTVCGGLITLGFIVISTVMAVRFGWQFGATETDRYVYATAGGLADLLKALLPLAIVGAWRTGEYPRCTTCAVVFAVFTAYSLGSSFGLAAIQQAEKVGEHTALATTYQDDRTEFERLRQERNTLGTQRPGDTVRADIARLKLDRLWDRSKGCTDATAKDSRELCQRYQALEGELATVKAAAELDSEIETIRGRLGGAGAKEAAKEADPQAAAFAQLTGHTKDWIRTALHAVFAIILELGSGLGLYMTIGHGRRVEPAPAMEIEPSRADVPAITSDLPAVAKEPTYETPSDAIKRFVLEQVRPALGSRITGGQMYGAYVEWCERQGLEPVSMAVFGKLIQWRKDRIGGRVRYLDAMLATRMVGPAQSLQVAIDNTASADRLRALAGMAMAQGEPLRPAYAGTLPTSNAAAR